MIPITTQISGIGPHADTFVDWQRAGSVLALVAPNGSGKTFLLEAGFACLYGDFPSRPGTIADNLTQGGTGKGQIEFAFQDRGVNYRAVRQIKASGQTATLYRDNEAIAGPKVRDFEATVEALFGNRATALATWFSPQGGHGDLTACQRVERREIIGGLLGLGGLDTISDRSGEAALRLEAKAETLSAQLQGLPDFDMEARRLHEAKCAEAAGKFDCERLLSSSQSELEQVRRAIRDTQGGEDVLKAQITAHENARVQEEQAASRCRVIAADITDLQKRIEKKPAAVEATNRIAEIDERIASLRAQEAAFRQRQTWERREAELLSDIDATRRELEALESQPGIDAETTALALKVESLLEEHASAKTENERRDERNGRRQTRIANLEAAVGAATVKINQATARLARKPETPFGERCAPCQFLREYAELPAQIEVWTKERDAALVEIESVPAAESLIDLSEIASRGAQARAARNQVEAQTANLRKVSILRENILAKSRLASDHKNAEPAVVTDPSAERQALEDETAGLRPAANLLPAIEQAERDLAKQRDALEEANALVARFHATTEELRGPAEAARQALLSREKATVGLRASESELASRIETLGKAREDAIRKLAQIAERTESLTRQRAESEERRADMKTANDRAERLRLLKKAFGKSGAQPILIDQAIPQLEAIACSMLERLTDGKMRLRFSTQKALKTGGIAEDFLILAQDSRGERDVATFSGGEKRILQTALRLALMIWIGRLHGRPADCLMIDEGFDALDGENAERMVELVKELARTFSRVIVVTHEEDIASKLPARVVLRRTALGTEVAA